MFERFKKQKGRKVMSEKMMTAAEQSAEATRKAGLAAEMAEMDDAQLADLARRAEVDASAYPKREDLIAAIELKAEEEAAKGRQALREMDEQERLAVSNQDSKRSATSLIIRALNAEFCRDIPQEGRGGSFEPEGDDPRFGGVYDVKNGKYRVAGSDWLFLISGKRLVSAETATEKNGWGGKAVIAIE